MDDLKLFDGYVINRENTGRTMEVAWRKVLRIRSTITNRILRP